MEEYISLVGRVMDIWLAKHNGAIQFDHTSQSLSPSDMAKELQKLGISVKDMATSSQAMPKRVGLPSGEVNLFLVDSEQAKSNIGRIASLSYWPWRQINATNEIDSCGGGPGSLANVALSVEQVWPHQRRELRSDPEKLSDLIGCRVRVHRSGAALDLSWIPDRVNVDVNDKDIVTAIWFG